MTPERNKVKLHISVSATFFITFETMSSSYVAAVAGGR